MCCWPTAAAPCWRCAGGCATPTASSPQARARLRESPEDSIRRFYFDTLTHDEELLRALIDFAGADHVLLGSDYPFDMGDARHVDTVRALGLAPTVEAAVLAGNAERLLGLESARREETLR